MGNRTGSDFDEQALWGHRLCKDEMQTGRANMRVRLPHAASVCLCPPLARALSKKKKKDNSEASAGEYKAAKKKKKTHSFEDSIVLGFHLHFQLISCLGWGQSVCVINNIKKKHELSAGYLCEQPKGVPTG